MKSVKSKNLVIQRWAHIPNDVAVSTGVYCTYMRLDLDAKAKEVWRYLIDIEKAFIGIERETVR